MLLSAENMNWAVGSHIEICFLIPGNKSIILYAEVVYNLHLKETEKYAGVRFVNTSNTVQDHLRQYIATLATI
jgi:c-di-GMP-binding flagellar brake protein YcgR